MSEPTAPSAAQPAPDLTLPPVPDICADVDPSVPVYEPGGDQPDPAGPYSEPSDAGVEC